MQKQKCKLHKKELLNTICLKKDCKYKGMDKLLCDVCKIETHYNHKFIDLDLFDFDLISYYK